MNIDYKLIGERIKRARKTRGMTQEILAKFYWTKQITQMHLTSRMQKL